jgi:peptidoglycan/LPS O-acetylase OafA/YrhL
MIQSQAESKNLDLLRSFAVAFVVISHIPLTSLGLSPPPGYHLQSLGLLGVLIFFVHTSLVLMLSLERQAAQWGVRRLHSTFLIRRIFRIYPLSVCVVCLVQLLSLVGVGRGFEGHLTSFAYDLLLVQNIPTASFTPDLLAALWSLPFEMQMYVFLPALFLLVRATGRRAPTRVVGLWLTAMALAFGLYRLNWRYDLVKYIPCFLPGVLAYALSAQKLSNQTARLSPLVLFSLVGALAVAYPMLVARGFRENLLAPFVCLALGITIPLCGDITSHVLQRLGKVIATYSYGVYLTHIFAIEIAFARAPQLPLIARLAIFIALMWILPWAAYNFIEAPGLGLGKRIAHSLQRTA